MEKVYQKWDLVEELSGTLAEQRELLLETAEFMDAVFDLGVSDEVEELLVSGSWDMNLETARDVILYWFEKKEGDFE